MSTTSSLAHLYNSIPLSIAILSTDETILHTTPYWQRSLEKFPDSHLFAEREEVWPNKKLNHSQLYKDLQSAIRKAATEKTVTSNIQTSASALDYTHYFTFFIAPITVNNESLILVSISSRMDQHSGTIHPALLSKDEARVLNSLREGVVIQDANGVITANNPASETIIGLTSDQMRGLANTDPKWHTITEDGQPCPPDQHPSSLAISKGIPILNFIMGINTPNDGVRWLKINSQPIFKENEDTPHMSITSFVDITEERHRQNELHQLTKRLQLALDAGNIAIWEYEIESQRLIWDDAMFKVFDVSPETFTNQLSDFTRTVHPEDIERINAKFNQGLTNRQGIISEFRILTKNNETRHIYVSSTHIKGNSVSADKIIGINRDITYEKEAEKALLTKHDKLVEFISNLPIAFFSVADNKVSMNKLMEALTGYSNTKLITTDDFFENLFNQHYKPSTEFHLSVTHNSALISDCILQIIRGDGSIRWMEFRGCRLGEKQAWAMLDITEQIHAEKKLKQLAFHDPLTQLPNRAAIEEKLIKSIYLSDKKNQKLGLLILDLDQFKNINDTHGHPIGDQLLVLVAERLKKQVRLCDSVGRMGGDEFMIIVEDISSSKQLLDIAQNLINSFTQPIHVSGQANMQMKTSISIGASIYPEHGLNHINLFKNADTALYRAKFLGKRRAQLYLEEFTLELQSKLSLENRIDQAMKESSFRVNFQPIVNSDNNNIIAAECLTRWTDPNLGNIPPDKFIPAAESSGQIIKLGAWVLKKACQEFVNWQKQGIHLDYIAVNISPVQFNDAALIENIQTTLTETGLSPKNLVLEITEGVLMHDQLLTKETLLKLKNLDIRLAIDDFGTGYSSLAYLKYFDVSILKIDKSFVTDIMTDPIDAQIAEAIISMAKSLNLSVVAEGVEEADQLSFLKENNCNSYQGYFKSPALNSIDFVNLIQKETISNP